MADPYKVDKIRRAAEALADATAENKFKLDCLSRIADALERIATLMERG